MTVINMDKWMLKRMLASHNEAEIEEIIDRSMRTSLALIYQIKQLHDLYPDIAERVTKNIEREMSE